MPMLKETMLKRLLLPMVAAGGGGSAPVQDTATGNPLTFLTDLAKPLKSLVIPFSDENGVTGLSVWNGGKNLFNKETAVMGVWWKGNILTGGSYYNYRASEKIPVLPNVRYILTRQSAQQGAVCYFNKNKQYIDQQTWDRYTPSRVIPDGVYYVSFTVEAEYIDSAQFEVGQTATAYEPYKPITETDISFPVSAGSPTAGQLDIISGVLTVTAPTAGTYQLTGEQITALVGNNTIWSDADGQMTATYLKKAQ